MKLFSYIKRIIKSQQDSDTLRIIKITGSVREKNILIYYKLNGATGGYSADTPDDLLEDIQVGAFNSEQSKMIYQLSKEQLFQPNYFIKNILFRKDNAIVIVYDVMQQEERLFSLNTLLENHDVCMGLSKTDLLRICALHQSMNTAKIRSKSAHLKVVNDGNNEK